MMGAARPRRLQQLCAALTATVEDVFAYEQEGASRTAALSPPCRGPVRLTNDGRLASAIVEAFNAHGFNTFAGAIHGPELELLQREVAALVDRAPDVLPICRISSCMRAKCDPDS